MPCAFYSQHTRADVETNTEELLTHTEKSGEEISNTVVLGTESGGQDEKQRGPDPGDSADSRPLPSKEIVTCSSLDLIDEGDFPEVDMKEILHQRMWETNSYQANEDHKNLYEALEKSMARDQTNQFLTDLAEARRKNKRRYDSPKTSLGS
nr:hypothetical protein [Tanacetum cinerariifolium]